MKIKEDKIIILELTSIEAQWLKRISQNYVMAGDEPEEDRIIREFLFSSLSDLIPIK